MLDEDGVPVALRHPLAVAYHREHPYVFDARAARSTRVDYVPAESDTGMFGGNSNWRGPVWMPVNVMLIRALLQLYSFFGDDFTVECPTGSGAQMTCSRSPTSSRRRLVSIFLRGRTDGRRPGTADREVPGPTRTGAT